MMPTDMPPQPLRPPLADPGPPQLAPVGAIGSGLGIPYANPVLDEIDKAHASLSAPAKEAIDKARMGLASPSAPAAPMGAASPTSTAAAPLTTPAHTAPPMGPAHQRAADIRQQGSGISQLANPWARIPLQVLDTIGRIAAPRIEAIVPGTEGHHQEVLGQADAAAQRETADQEAASKMGLERAQAQHASAQADALKTPPEKDKPEDEQKTLTTDQGIFQWNPSTHRYDIKAGDAPDKPAKAGTVHQLDDGSLIIANPDGTATPVTMNGKPVKGKGPEPKSGDEALGDRVPQINAALTSRFQILHPGKPLPEHYALPANATQKDFDRTDKLLEGEEKAFGTDQTRKQTEEMRKQTLALAAGNREHKDETELKQAVSKEYAPARDAADRLNTMSKNYEDAVKNHDQQAMLSLLTNHIGMTLGAQKGARITRDILNEAVQSRPWLQGLEAKFDKDGILSGVTLTPQQMRQMVDLGREKFNEAVQRARNGAKYLGATDDGPERTPNAATINHYVGLANGDAKKAKELAAADGWSVK